MCGLQRIRIAYVLMVLASKIRSLVFVQLAEHPGSKVLTTLASRDLSLVVVWLTEHADGKVPATLAYLVRSLVVVLLTEIPPYNGACNTDF